MKKQNSIIIPVHNESENLASQIDILQKKLHKNSIAYKEIILVENGSTDNSLSICKQLAKKYSKVVVKQIAPPSYGLAVKHGMLSAKGTVIILLNADFFDIQFIKKGLKLISKYHLVNGSKRHHDTVDNRPFFLTLRTKVLNILLKIIFNFKGTDTHGIKIFKNTKQLQNILLSSVAKHELFDTELVLKLQKKYKELPVKISEIRPSRYTNWNRIKRTLIDLFRLSSYFLFSQKLQTGKQVVVEDDFGMSPLISNAILDLVSTNQVSVVSVLTNSVSTKKLKELKKTDASVAVHLNLVRGKPLSNPNKVLSLINRNTGEFHNLPQFLVKLLLGKVDLDEITYELEKQIQFLKKSGLKVTQLNSEQHTHIFQPVKDITSQLASKHKIATIRTEDSVAEYLSWRVHKYIIMRLFTKILEKKYSERKSVRKQKKRKTNRTEIICHPGSSYD